MARELSKTVKEVSEPQSMTIYGDNGEVLSKYSPELLDTIKDTVAKGASNHELYMFLQVASSYGLNPFKKEIYFVKMKTGNAIMTTRDGYLKIASEKPDFKKIQSVAVYENDTFEVQMEMGEVVNIKHNFTQNDRGKIVCAYCVLFTHSGNDLFTIANFREHTQGNQIWKKYPSLMIRKVAEADVLKRYANISGLMTVEEAPTEFQREIEVDDYVSDDSFVNEED